MTPEEQALAKSIEFDANALVDRFDRDGVVQNGELVAQLFTSLQQRKAIPVGRLRYFTEPEYNLSTPKRSHAETFKLEAGNYQRVTRHAHFLKYISYFIYGAPIPVEVKDEFEKVATNTFREWDGLSQLAKRLVPKVVSARTVEDYNADDAFFRLALDCGCALAEARQVRDAVKRAVAKV